MRIFNDRPGAIKESILKIPDSYLENAAVGVLSVLILQLPAKIILAIMQGQWLDNYEYAAIQSYIVIAALLIWVIYASKKFFEEGAGIKKRLTSAKGTFIFFLAFMIWAFVSSCMAESPRIAFYSDLHRNEGFVTYMYYFIIFLTGSIVVAGKKKRIILDVFAGSSTLICFTAILKKYPAFAEFAGLDNSALLNAVPKFSGVFSYFNHYGYFLAMAVLACAGLIASDRKKINMLFHSAFFIINLWTLVINDTFGSYIGALIGVISLTLLFLIRRWKADHGFSIAWCLKVILPLMLFIAVSMTSSLEHNPINTQIQQLTKDVNQVIVAPSAADSAGTGRWLLWKTALGYVKERPAFGYGSEGLINKFSQDGFIQDRPANEYIQYAAFFGIPGAAFYILALIALLIYSITSLKKMDTMTLAVGGCVIAYGVSACFGNTMYYTTIYFYMYMGLLIRYEIKENHIEKENQLP